MLMPDDTETKDGHTIQVNSGIYKENVIIDKKLKIIGFAIIDGIGNIGISVKANNTILENMNIFNSSTGIFIHNDSFTIN